MKLYWWIKIGYWRLIFPKRRAVTNAVFAMRLARSDAEVYAISAASLWWFK